jgi:hypothetical protein
MFGPLGREQAVTDMTVSRTTMKSALLATLLIVDCGGSAAWSQGSTGGSLGNDNKSLSGSSPEPRATAPARRERSEQRAAPSRRGSSDGSGDVSRFDGTWAIMLVGRSGACAGKTTSTTFTISGGRAGNGGRVSPSGVFQGTGNTDGVGAIMNGRLSGRSGSGTMSTTNGCTLRWTASKQ